MDLVLTDRRTTGSARPVLAAVLTLVLGGLVGCGSDGADDDGAPIGDAGAVTAADPADEGFCEAFGSLIAGPLADERTDAADPAVLRVAVEATRELLDRLVATAPASLAAPARAFADEYGAGFAVWERYGYDLDRVTSEATAEEQAVLDRFLAGPEGPGVDPLDALEDGFFERCSTDVTLPPDLTATTAG